ncbi:MAG: ornithine cyclodeaminase family protein [Chloroflexota bacterium]|nr:ornithine cyclodeaminase family protein [Chloroflexota bacterium]MDE2884237.1 ornithine cyclodeaminase family protein [Chloroflexota bacterium]
MLLINEQEVHDLLPMDECIEVLDAAFAEWAAGSVSNMPRYRLPLMRGAQQLMAGMSRDAGATGLKTYVSGTQGSGRMVVLLFSTEDGSLLAMLSANALGQIRTGAASGVATRHMARADASAVAIIGTGSQAGTQLEAVAAVRPLERAFVYSRTPDRREAFAQRMSSQLGIDVRPAESAHEAVSQAAVVCAITNSREPVFDGDSLSPGTHVNAAGSNHWMRREIDETTIRRSDIVVVDDLEDAKNECGELIWAVERRAFRWENAVELRDVVAGRTTGRPSPESITLFESQGLAMEDVTVGMHVYRKAMDGGIGTQVEL